MAKAKAPKRRIQKNNAPKTCYFCDEKKQPTFSEIGILQRFLTERGKIISRSRNGLCSSHQKALTIEIKQARHLALLPFIVR
jgi:small subunit ribosomal protein S18